MRLCPTQTNKPILNSIELKPSVPINSTGLAFISDLGHNLTRISGEPRETSHLFQCVSIIIRRFNAVALPRYLCLPELEETVTLPDANNCLPTYIFLLRDYIYLWKIIMIILSISFSSAIHLYPELL